MGLAASQAKLLSLTCRISDNELRAQSITAAKMALANQTAEASRNYIKALNQNEFIYKTYDEDGDKVYTALTGTQLSTYAPLKNQYALVNPKGQVLVSELDAGNYNNSANLVEFVEKYGVNYVPSGKTKTVINPEYEEKYNAWLELYNKWLSEKPDESLERYWDTKTTTNHFHSDEFADAFAEITDETKGGVCYKDATDTNSPDKQCYLHVLDCLIDFESVPGTNQNANKDKTLSYITTTGDILEITDGHDHGNDYGEFTGSSIWDNASPELLEKMTRVSYAIHYGWNGGILYAPEDTSDTLSVDSPKKDKILSSYYFDENGDKQRKTMYQYLIDVYYAIKDNFSETGSNTLGTDYNTELIPIIHNIQNNLTFDFDIVNTYKQHTTEWYTDYKDWLDGEPSADKLPSPTLEEDIYEFDDKDKAQWYVNLWHRMNGESDDKAENTAAVANSTSSSGRGWDILEDGLMNSQDWLKYALESGSVSLERVNFTEPTPEDTGLKQATWTATIYTNALDISQQTDETAIAKAEAAYEQKSRELENKDKQYDSMLKLLDTEHNALQQEYETAKTVIQKNMDRTLKIYSQA